MEGSAEWSATGVEYRGWCKPGGSIPHPSAMENGAHQVVGTDC
ncbi:hypothetical protein FDH96_gp152 [Mycobacterium phage Rey]|uniref:Uncharacterized protein n=1 Tax=Mycobacterium phage Rey TaxID=1034115 RepID=G1D5G7_9CAUD|nr:hypothetical protein FDH96_gp152 [Mycobacterium phage Rey]AEK10065.1 hypothetical protein PBI_REY_113 [Mycobacterium phage Rey]